MSLLNARCEFCNGLNGHHGYGDPQGVCPVLTGKQAPKTIDAPYIWKDVNQTVVMPELARVIPQHNYFNLSDRYYTGKPARPVGQRSLGTAIVPLVFALMVGLGAAYCVALEMFASRMVK